MPLPSPGRDTSRPQPQSQPQTRARSERSSSSPLSSATPSPQLGPTPTSLTTGATRAAALGKNAGPSGPLSRSSSVLSGLDADSDDDAPEQNHLGHLGLAEGDLSDDEVDEEDDDAAERASSQTSSTIPLSRRSSLNSSSSDLTQVDDDEEQTILEDMDVVQGAGHVNGASRDEGEDVSMEPMDVDADTKDEENLEEKEMDTKPAELDDSLSIPPSKRYVWSSSCDTRELPADRVCRRRINSSASRRSPSLTPPPTDELSAQPLPDIAADGDPEDDEQDADDAEDDEEAEDEEGQANGDAANGDSDAEENDGDVTLRQEDLKGAAAAADAEDADADDLSDAPDPEPEADAEEAGDEDAATDAGAEGEDAEEAQETDGADAAEEEADHEAAGEYLASFRLFQQLLISARLGQQRACHSRCALVTCAPAVRHDDRGDVQPGVRFRQIARPAVPRAHGGGRR